MDVLINGIMMRYEDIGEGPTLLLLHAFPLSGAMWRAQVEALRNRYRLIVPDLRGFGGSEAPPGLYPMDQLADDVMELLSRLGLERSAVCGLSMGGYISFAIMRRYAERVVALVLADTKAGADTDEGKVRREENARVAESQGPVAIVERMIPGLVAPDAPEELRAELRALITANSPDGIAGALRGMAQRPDSTPDLAAISVPTLIIVGAADGLTPPAEAQAMHAAIAGSRLVEIPGVGHLSNMEDPAGFNTALGEFLAEVEW